MCERMLAPFRFQHKTHNAAMKRLVLLVKRGEQRVVKLRVNPASFGRHTSRTLRRVLLQEIIDEQLPALVGPNWHGARVYTILPIQLC